MREIGSNFWQSEAEYQTYAGSNDSHGTIPAMFEPKGSDRFYFSTGRQAIRFCLEDIKSKNKTALIPEFTCQSVIQPFLLEGYRVVYYSVNKELITSISKINEMIETYDVSVLLIHPYFGFDTIIADETFQKDVSIILDATQSLFSRISYNGINYVIASIRKWGPFLDGALCVKTVGKFSKATNYGENFALITVLEEAFSQKASYIEGRDNSKDDFRELYAMASNMIDTDNDFYTMADKSMRTYLNYNFELMCAARQANFRYLLEYTRWEQLGDVVFSELAKESVPLYFPVHITKTSREKLQNYLATNEIFVPIIWSKPAYDQRDSFHPDSKWIYSHTLSFPIDQRYSREDMKRIMMVLDRYER